MQADAVDKRFLGVSVLPPGVEPAEPLARFGLVCPRRPDARAHRRVEPAGAQAVLPDDDHGALRPPKGPVPDYAAKFNRARTANTTAAVAYTATARVRDTATHQATIRATTHGIYETLGGDTRLLERKHAVPLRLDFHAPELGLFIEVDVTQHFTAERARTLEAYGRDHGLDHVDEYKTLINKWKRAADRYRAAKEAVDFRHPGGRRAQRAYLDTVRDLAAPKLGIRLLRIPAPECDPRQAFARFETYIASASEILG